jgi:hypothetical protein
MSAMGAMNTVRAPRARLVATCVVGAALALTACASPEAQRRRGGGAGGDVRNRDPIVQMHAGSRMYFETPCLLPEERCTGPRQASGLSGDFPEPR